MQTPGAMDAALAGPYLGALHSTSSKAEGMSRSLNKVMLIGNVGNDPEIKTTGGGTKIAKVSLATNRTFNDRSGQQQEKTEWHRLTFWDKMADLVDQYVKKGDRLYVEGRIEYSQTEDDKGNQRFWTDIVVREMVMLGGAGSAAGGGGYDSAPRRRQPAQGGSNRPSSASPFDAEDDDLPF
jgi:single-strand DNA-binding protein